MCYDVAFKTNLKSIQDDFPEINIEPQLALCFNDIDHIQAQGNMSYGIIVLENSVLSGEHMLWAGILNQRRERVYNARSESVLDKKSLWYKIRNNRGLIPVTGIFEHRGIPGWKNKAPYYVRQTNREIFYLPCLYDDGNIVDHSTGEIPRSFTLLTTRGNEVMKEIHNADPADPRMPLFLNERLEKKWLSEDLTVDEMHEICNYQISSDELVYTPVFTIRGRKPRPDGKFKTDAYEWEKLPPLTYIRNH